MSLNDLFGKKTSRELEGLKRGLEKFMELSFNAFGKLEDKIKNLEDRFYALERNLGVGSPVARQSVSLSSSSNSGLPPPPSLPSLPTQSEGSSTSTPQRPSTEGSIYQQVGAQLQGQSPMPSQECAPLTQDQGAASSTLPPTPSSETGQSGPIGTGLSLHAQLQSELADAFRKIRTNLEEEEEEEEG
ncbi:MAG: hypothetical protein ACFFC7_01060 [Candidatus Hermodarchaeota archaeon]